MYELVENVIEASHNNWPIGVDESGFYICKKGKGSAVLVPFKDVRRIRTYKETVGQKAKESAGLAIGGLVLIGINVALIYGAERFFPILLLLGAGLLIGGLVNPFLRRSVKLEVHTDSDQYKGTVFANVWKRRGQTVLELLNNSGCQHETDLELE